MARTIEDHVRQIIEAVQPWEIRMFGPDYRLSAGELSEGADYLCRLLKEHDKKRDNLLEREMALTRLRRVEIHQQIDWSSEDLKDAFYEAIALLEPKED